jgi:1,4-alpha-glucan branching enzyme
MLYLDYSRKEGEWLPNEHGGRENLEAVAFLRALNAEIGLRAPKVLMIAEESTAWPGVSRPVHEGGLGFGFKWDMGWMNDVLRHLARDPLFRRHHHDELTFRSLYHYAERFLLPLSHDEVVYGKGSLYGKMPGDPWQKRANLRLLLGLQVAQPGKKLQFMGTEIGSAREWDHDGELEWALPHRDLAACVGALNRLYRDEPALHRGDCRPEGFVWIAGDDVERSVMCWLRVDPDDGTAVLCVVSTTPSVHEAYRIGVPVAGDWTTLLSTDEVRFGGSGVVPSPTVSTEVVDWHGHPQSVVLDLPPLGVLFLRSPA